MRGWVFLDWVVRIMFGVCCWLVVESKIWRGRADILQSITGLRHELHQTLSMHGETPALREWVVPYGEIVETRVGDLYALELQTEGGHVSVAYRWGRPFKEYEVGAARLLFVDVGVSGGYLKRVRCDGPPWRWYEIK